MKLKSLLLTLLVCFQLSVLFARENQGYYMHPDIHRDVIVFVAEGDIWKVASEGGQASRLTTHPGEERFPKISPDGKWVAYAASYEGPTEVYLIPIQGGIPKRLTYEASPSVPTAWKSATELAYVTNQYATLPRLHTITIDIETGKSTTLPLEMAAEGSFSDDGNTYFFVRPTFHNNVTKRYEGGTARQVWKYTNGDEEAIKLTKNYKGEDHHPTYHEGRVYFLSSRDGIVNVWSMNVDGEDLKQHTQQEHYDVREASFSEGKIAYRVGADIHIFDIKSGEDQKLAVSLNSDFDQMREKWVDNPESYITGISVSNEGDKVALTARGRSFIFPTKQGRRVRLDRKDGVRLRDATFSVDGKEIFVFSDESGEFEIHQYNALGLDTGKKITSNGNTLRFNLTPSPDVKKLAFTDLNKDLWVLDLASGKQVKASTNREGVSGSFVWSPDSQWIAFSQSASNTFNQIFAFKVSSEKHIAITSDRANSVYPQWSTDGNWIYFMSDRNFETRVNSPWGTRQPEPFWEKQMKIYHISLKKDLVSPFHYNHELKKEEKKAEGEVQVVIEEEGLMQRLREVPVPAGNYSNLVLTDKALYYQSEANGGGKNSIMMTPLSSKVEQKVFADNIRRFVTSANNKYMLITVGSNHHVVEIKTSPVGDLAESKLDLSNWKFSIDPREDWRQLYRDAWRMERDYYYDPNMHGVDWDKMYEKYLPLAERVTSRAELSDVIGELIGELSVLHTSVGGGDLRRGDEQINLGLLGARFSKNEMLKGFQVDYIYQSDPDYPDEMSPLSHPDIQINVGDVITHVDGQEVLAASDINYYLRDKAGQQVRLSLVSEKGAKLEDRIIIPMNSRAESNLRYNDWEYSRRLAAEEASDGAIGYVHLRAMTGSDISQWYRDFYPQFKKSGLIIDVRNNRGGNIDSFILEKLMREAFFYWKNREGEPYWNMQYAFRGHLVLLVDEFTASDGEAFAEGFRRLNLGKSIGARTWGGEVWLSGSNTLSDNGVARAPMMGVYGEEGEWLIEGEGFIPDIEVINLPKATFEGKDAQLDAAIKHLKELIKEDPRTVPSPPAYPDKSFRNN
ncbi:Tol biopolymer transport system, periplasmic component-related protein [Belliella baltica DSM 15883]|uniref:Tricorn protease homolog n=1 Tax=Belliella baltica (strain DSM 15883 / CIP 108006 / LMG 21964 / BA134) TaxID=866536 RepID=I3Z6Q3_BELBD|nr:S41 family peptidase [Belliella baltica]AFL84921.1 Tol biopolymer transport system, periplasmic component-related protein [Belliella baltica DSM 15883]